MSLKPVAWLKAVAPVKWPHRIFLRHVIGVLKQKSASRQQSALGESSLRRALSGAVNKQIQSKQIKLTSTMVGIAAALAMMLEGIRGDA